MASLSSLTFSLLSCFLIFSPSSSSPIPSQLMETLLNSNYVAMGLTLQKNSQNLITSSAATIFSPSESSFSSSGQPSLSLLRYHVSPIRLPPEFLQVLPFGTKIPTISPNQDLIVTTANRKFSLNSVNVNISAVYDDGLFIVYGIARFFDPSFSILTVNPVPVPAPSPPILIPGCADCSLSNTCSAYFSRPSNVLNANGYSVMSALLDLQLLGLPDRLNITVFAPVDDVLSGANYRDYASILKRHVVPGKFSVRNMRDLQDGTQLQTFLEDFSVNISNSGDILVNGVSIIYPDMYNGESVAVHGIKWTM